MKALDLISNDKQIDLQESRNKSRQVWQELEDIFNCMDPNMKSQITNTINKYSQLRDKAKEKIDKQRRVMSASRDPVMDQINETSKIIA